MTDTPTFTGAETRILSKLMEAKEPVAKDDLMAAAQTTSDPSFKVILSKLRGKGFMLTPPRGQAVKASYALTDVEKARLRSLGL